jgi:hypothetical protein
MSQERLIEQDPQPVFARSRLHTASSEHAHLQVHPDHGWTKEQYDFAHKILQQLATEDDPFYMDPADNDFLRPETAAAVLKARAFHQKDYSETRSERAERRQKAFQAVKKSAPKTVTLLLCAALLLVAGKNTFDHRVAIGTFVQDRVEDLHRYDVAQQEEQARKAIQKAERMQAQEIANQKVREEKAAQVAAQEAVAKKAAEDATAKKVAEEKAAKELVQKNAEAATAKKEAEAKIQKIEFEKTHTLTQIESTKSGAGWAIRYEPTQKDVTYTVANSKNTPFPLENPIRLQDGETIKFQTTKYSPNTRNEPYIRDTLIKIGDYTDSNGVKRIRLFILDDRSHTKQEWLLENNVLEESKVVTLLDGTTNQTFYVRIQPETLQKPHYSVTLLEKSSKLP